MITMHGGMYLAHRTEGRIQARTCARAVGLRRDGAGLCRRRHVAEVRRHRGFRHHLAIDPAALPDPLAKTVVRSADAWWPTTPHSRAVGTAGAGHRWAPLLAAWC
jgi:cytochrome d ubiquinol oxidase subunit II